MALPNRATINTYDGQGKINGIIPPSNQSTDWNNPSLGQCVSDVAAIGQPAPRAWVQFTSSTTTGGLVLLAWQAMWKNATNTTPVLVRTGTGVITITFPVSVNDEYDASLGITSVIPLQFSGGIGSMQAAGIHSVGILPNGNIATVYLSNASGASDFSGTNFIVILY